MKAGLVGALPLGAVLALAFCPVSAGLFFGGLIPLALEHRSSLWLPALYGLGTGLPVVVFAVLVSAGLAWAGAAFHRLQSVERWARHVTAVMVIAVGLYYTWSFTIRGGSSSRRASPGEGESPCSRTGRVRRRRRITAIFLQALGGRGLALERVTVSDRAPRSWRS